MSLVWSASLSASDEKYRMFTSSDGDKLEAQVVSCEPGESVTLRRSDGRIFENVPWSRFSSEDHDYLKDWAKAEAAKINRADLTEDARLEITVLKGIDDDFNEYGDIDDRVIQFEPEVVIESDELYRTFTDVDCVLMIIGQGYINDDEYVILSRQAFELTLPPEEKVRWVGKPFMCRYDPDYGGFDYGGYLLVLKNRAGEIVFSKASKQVWERSAVNVMDAKPRTGYNRDFTAEVKLWNAFGLPE